MSRHGPRSDRADRPQRTDGRGDRRGASASAVLRTILRDGPVARSTIARQSGLSAAAVSGHTAELTRLGLVCELPEAAGPRGLGRPHVPVDLDVGRFVAGGLHLAVHHATIALLDLRGRVLVQHDEPHEGLGPEQLLARAAEIFDDLLLEHAPEQEPLGIGVATGGRVDAESGTVLEHPQLGWHDVGVRTLLASCTGLPVEVDGHSRALVHAERLFGGHDAESVVQLFAGNVVDAAFATGDAVHHGPHAAAGAVAHLPVDDSTEPCGCGRTGCLEATVSEGTLARKAVEAGILADESFVDLLALAARGNSAARALFTGRARLIGQAATLLLDVLDPDRLVVVDRSLPVLPELLSTIRDEVRIRSSVARDVGKTVVPTSFPGTELATAGGAVLLGALYTDPLGPLLSGLAAAR